MIKNTATISIFCLVLISCNLNSNWIYGKWKVVHSNQVPFEHISFCEKLYLNSIYEFRKDHTLYVYENLESQACIDGAQTFKLEKDKIEFFEYDMLFEFDLLILERDSIQLKINGIPSYFYELDWNIPEIENQANKIEKNGITITLKKINGS